MKEDQLERVVQLLRPHTPVVFDLDGTLVRLQVDWREAQAALGRIARTFGKDPGGRTVWEMLREASGKEAAALGAALERFEIDGGRTAQPLPLADILPQWTREEVGIVSLNGHASVDEALRVTGLTRHIGIIVAREDAAHLKPDPEPLLLCIKRLGGTPEGAVFVGDRDRDRETAQAAGTAYFGVDDLLG